MIESIDEYFVAQVECWKPPADTKAPLPQHFGEIFAAQLLSRHLDLAARRLQQEGNGFYTIGSCGHESNALVAAALRPTDPSLLHYRSGGFYCARAAQVDGHDPVSDILLSLTASADDPISGGRHKVFGNTRLHIIPQTSTIASHLPRAMGMAFALGRAAGAGFTSPWPGDAVVVTSLGDASINHSTAVGALNATGHAAYQGVPMPLLVVCEDNGIGISVRSPAGWVAATLSSRPGFRYEYADGSDPLAAAAVIEELVEHVRMTRSPGILHLRTVRLMGHAGSDAEIAYRSARDIVSDYPADPLLASASALVASGEWSPQQVLDAYEGARTRVQKAAERLRPVHHLMSEEQVTAPLAIHTAYDQAQLPSAPEDRRQRVFRGKVPEEAGALTLAQSINATLTDLLAALPEAIVFGEDVGVKGGVYGVTRGLRRAFGATRVFDTLLDEQSILGTALGASLCGFLPIPEIQYLAYLHNAEDQLRGEAASLRFFSDGQYQNGMVVRVQGLAYQRGFGGHFHSDNSVAVLLDIPGVVVGVPSSAAEAPGMLRAMASHARSDGRVCVFLEPIALYHSRDLHAGDGAWTSPYDARGGIAQLSRGAVHRDGTDVLVVTFGNGVPMSLRVADDVAAEGGPNITVLDLRWLAPLPMEHLLTVARGFDRVLVVDETRHSGGVGQSVVDELVAHSYPGHIRRVSSADSFVPLGPAASTVLLGEDDIRRALKEVMNV